MILFVFEGAKTEPLIYSTIKNLYFKDSEDITYIFNSNIYGLYNRIKREFSDFSGIEDAADVVSILQEMHPESELSKISTSSQIDQIFLFFDYDFQHAFHIKEQHQELDLEDIIKEDNHRIEELLDFFNDETNMGKLYINYPMIESLKYTKSLPDVNFNSYVVTLEDCHKKFKRIAEEFSDYKGYKGLLYDVQTDIDIVKNNWELLKEQNVGKANFMCNCSKGFPSVKTSISQDTIFLSQMMKYTSSKLIYILSSFPIFLYDYFK